MIYMVRFYIANIQKKNLLPQFLKITDCKKAS